MEPVGIYIHVPFCRGKCPYCDFYSVTAKDELLDRYTEETVRRVTELAPRGLSADTVYFGGGTPSLLGGRRITAIMDALRRSVDISGGAEITAEANPASDLSEFLEGCAASGISRLSLGMQSALPSELSALGRRHRPDDVMNAMEQSRRVGIDNISLDLMLGIPMQTADSLEDSLRFIECASPAHVSAYMLKIEENTPFYRIQYALKIADGDELADMYEQTFDRLERAGYAQYEISNAARPGFESRHNLKYWNCDPYIGIGPSAHSFFEGKRFFYERDMQSFNDNVITADGTGGDEEEFIMLSLRLAQGLDFDEYKKRFDREIPKSLIKTADKYIKAGLMKRNGNRIFFTPKGFLVSNAVISKLI